MKNFTVFLLVRTCTFCLSTYLPCQRGCPVCLFVVFLETAHLHLVANFFFPRARERAYTTFFFLTLPIILWNILIYPNLTFSSFCLPFSSSHYHTSSLTHPFFHSPILTHLQHFALLSRCSSTSAILLTPGACFTLHPRRLSS